jgi:hypothetical protein
MDVRSMLFEGFQELRRELAAYAGENKSIEVNQVRKKLCDWSPSFLVRCIRGIKSTTRGFIVVGFEKSDLMYACGNPRERAVGV